MSGSERVKRPTIIRPSSFVRHKDFAEPSCDKSCAGIDRDDLAGGLFHFVATGLWPVHARLARRGPLTGRWLQAAGLDDVTGNAS